MMMTAAKMKGSLTRRPVLWLIGSAAVRDSASSRIVAAGRRQCAVDMAITGSESSAPAAIDKTVSLRRSKKHSQNRLKKRNPVKYGKIKESSKMKNSQKMSLSRRKKRRVRVVSFAARK